MLTKLAWLELDYIYSLDLVDATWHNPTHSPKYPHLLPMKDKTLSSFLSLSILIHKLARKKQEEEKRSLGVHLLKIIPSL
jgi:hypothetical protein